MKKGTRILSIVLAIVLILGMLAACGTDNKGGSAAGSSTKQYVDTGEYTGPAMDLTFSFASGENVMKIYVDTEERITARTGGKVTFTNYFGGSLASATEALDACGSGMADLADLTLTNFQDRFPYSQQITACPFLGFRNFQMAADVLRNFIPNNEYCMAEFDAANVKPLFFTGVWGTSFIFREETTLNGPKDLTGKKIISTTDLENRFLQDCGATPVAQPVTELYSLMQNGVVDGAMMGLYVTDIFGALQLAKSVYMLERSFTTGCRAFCINKDVWNSFNDELKKIFEEEFGGEQLWQEGCAYWAEQDQQHLDNCEKWNIPVTYIEGDAMNEWIEVSKPYTQEKLDKMKADGYDHAQEVYDDLVAAIDSYDGEWK